MCGIVGICRRAGSVDLGRLESMTDVLTHRGPDDRGTWRSRSGIVGLGHRRLSVLDPTPAGRQPMMSVCERFVLTYNGEIYNFKTLRDALESEGRTFRTGTDTEVLVEGFAEWGVEETLARLNGMFALAAWDHETGELYLARDRAGIKPLYWSLTGDEFLFGSELKAIRSVTNTDTLHRGAVANYFRYGYVPGAQSIFESIKRLGAGMMLTYSPETGSLVRGSFLPEPNRSDAGSLKAVLQSAVRDQMISDVPLGAFLSGGIDSSLLVALMQEMAPRPVQTFSIGFTEAEYNEAPFAKQVAEHLRTDHTELTVTAEEAQSVIPDLAGMFDEPFADASQIPTYLVSRLAREHVTVSLAGDGADEWFAGYRRYLYGRDLWSRIDAIPGSLRKAAGAILSVAPRGSLRHLARNLKYESPARLYRDMMSMWSDPSEILTEEVEGDEPWLQDRLSASSDHLVDWMMTLDQVQYLPDDILVKTDRTSMAVSLEVRVPFLDNRVTDFARSMSWSDKLDGDRSKAPLRNLLYQYVPREMVDRPKQGFDVPVEEWIRGPLRDWAEELLKPDRLEEGGLLRSEPIRTLWGEHRDGTADHRLRIWPVIMFQAWRESLTR